MGKTWRGLQILPKAKITPTQLSKVLNDVNYIRLALLFAEGKLTSLPAGDPEDPEMCVLAQALSGEWRVYVDGDIVIAHENPDESFDWVKAERKLRARFSEVEVLGQNEGDAFIIDYMCAFDDLSENPEKTGFRIGGTKEMRDLITDFDDRLLPDLILNGN